MRKLLLLIPMLVAGCYSYQELEGTITSIDCYPRKIERGVKLVMIGKNLMPISYAKKIPENCDVLVLLDNGEVLEKNLLD